MTHTKHIIIVVLVLIAFGLSANAQSTLQFPYEGSIHTYSVNGITVGANYNFYITANADRSGLLDDVVTSEFEILNATGIVDSDGLASTPIQWNNGAAAHIYYLWLEATVVDGCSNHIRLTITPQVNQFDLLSENIPVDNTISCPAVNTADGFNPLAAGYDAGTTTLQFKVRRTGGNRNWKFEPVLTIDPTWNIDIAVLSIVGANSGTLVADASNVYTVNALDNEVLVTVSVKNQPGNTQVVSFEVKNQSEADTNLLDSNSSNDKVTHTIQIMPVINSMGGA